MDISNQATSAPAVSQSVTMQADTAKILAMITLGGGCLFLGLLPAFFTRARRRRPQFSVSAMLCFGAGVLLATSLVHMLPEVRENLGDRSEVIYCLGFFIVYIVDELVHACCGEAIRHTHDSRGRSRERRHSDGETHAHDHETHQHQHHQHGRYGSSEETRTLLDSSASQRLSYSSYIRQEEDAADAEANARICHTTHREPCEQSLAGHAGLLCALTLHSLLEGLAIGVQDTGGKVLLLLGAVSCHKFVVGFCLGIELCSTPGSRFRNHLIAILIFTFGSVFGIGIGMCMSDMKELISGQPVQVLQAVAGGTLLYVTVCEILPREKARWHMGERRFAGFLQCIAVLVGFGTMTLLTDYLSE